MPAGQLDFRDKCGHFMFVFISFMTKRAKRKVDMRIQTVSVRSKTTGVWVGVLLTLLFFGDLIHRCGDVEKNPGPTTETGAPTTRSQTRTAEPTLKDVMSLLQSLDGKFDDMRSDMNELKREYNELKEEVDTLKNELTDLRRSNDDLYNENEDLRDRLSKIERVTDNLENRSRRNNVLFLWSVEIVG